MGSQLRKIYSGVLYKDQLWAAIAELGPGVVRRLCLDSIKFYLEHEDLKPDLHPRDPVNSKTPQSITAAANTEVTRAGSWMLVLLLQAIKGLARLIFFIHSYCKQIMNTVQVYKQASSILPESKPSCTRVNFV